MSNSFAYNTVTHDGAALIAQATAANPIVIVGAKSCTLAAQDNADLSSKPLSWYDGKSGTIAAVSATDAVARIVAKYTNSGTAQTVKSFCITARLASQSDAQAVVLTAKSDPDAAVFLPGADDVSMIVNIPHSISIETAGTVEVTPGASASVADLERFVSLFKAGQPSVGESQEVLGTKTFAGTLRVRKNSNTMAFSSSSGGVEINVPLTLDASAYTFDITPDYDGNDSGAKFSLGKDDNPWDRWKNVVAENIIAKNGVSGNLTGNLIGLIPTGTETGSTQPHSMEVGEIILAYIECSSAVVFRAGSIIDMGNSSISNLITTFAVASHDNATGWSAGQNLARTMGATPFRFKLMSEGGIAGTATYFVALIIRINNAS